MPYTKDSPNLPGHVKKLPDKERAVWAKTWNGTYKKCRSENGGNQKKCEERAFQIANGLLKSGIVKSKEATTVTKGMAKSMGKQKTKGKCPECGLAIPKYPGRYPKKCPNCKAELGGKEKEGGDVKEAIQAKVDELITESGRDVSEDVREKVKQLIEESSGEKLEENFIERADEVLVTLREAAQMKTEDGAKFPASAFAYVPDSEKPDTWKLRLTESDKGTTRKQLDRIAARFSEGGYSGKKADIPAEAQGAVKARIREAYRGLGVDDKDIPKWVKEVEPRALVGEFGGIEVAEATAERLADGVLPVRFLAPGFNTDDSRFYTTRAIKDAAVVFEGLKMYANHPTKSEDRERPERDVRDWVANLRNCRVSSSGNAVGDAIIHEGWFKEKVRGLQEAGELTELGTSIIGVGKGVKGKMDGKKTHMIEGIVKGRSVDFVTEPGAGGRAGLRESIAAEGYDPDNDVDLLDEAGLRERRPDLVAIIETATEKKLQEEFKTMEELKAKIEELDGQVATLTEERDGLKAELEEAERKERVVTAQAEIAELVDAADLREATKVRIKTQFAEADSTDGVPEAIEAEKKYVADLNEAGDIRDLGRSDTADDAETARKSIKENAERRYREGGYTEDEAKRMADTYLKGK